MVPVERIELPSELYKSPATPLSYTGTHPQYPTVDDGEDDTLTGVELRESLLAPSTPRWL